MVPPDEPISHYSSSAGDLSSPPSENLSELGSPPRSGHPRENIQIPDIINGEPLVPSRIADDGKRYGIVDGKEVQLRADGMPRKKPGRKPGILIKHKQQLDDHDIKIRKVVRREAESVPAISAQRKRKIAPAVHADIGADSKSLSNNLPLSNNVYDTSPSCHDLSGSIEGIYANIDRSFLAQKAPKLDSLMPHSMQRILNEETDSQSAQQMPTSRSSGQRYDPIRGNYDLVREVPRHILNPNQSTRIESHIPPISVATALVNTETPIARLIQPLSPPIASPSNTHASSICALEHGVNQNIASNSPEHPLHPTISSLILKNSPGSSPFDEGRAANPLYTLPSKPRAHAALIDTAAPLSRKINTKQKAGIPITTMPSGNQTIGDDTPQVYERSILDFGKASPGEELHAPSIVLNIPISTGETNRYVNFLRMAEDSYGWDALHPRQAANRDRKARIAAASAALEKAGIGSGRESGDEMSVDLSDIEGSNAELGVSGVDVLVKPARKKRYFKEDEYDVEDDFVDDSELQWENQAAASRDGFFVYMGPLVRESEKAIVTGNEGPSRGRGRRGGGPGSRGGRGGSSRGPSTSAANAVNRVSGIGSRGGIARKSRGTKMERVPRDKPIRDNARLDPLTSNLSLSTQ